MWVKRVLDVADDIFFVIYQVSLKFLNDTMVCLKWIFVIAQFLDEIDCTFQAGNFSRTG